MRFGPIFTAFLLMSSAALAEDATPVKTDPAKLQAAHTAIAAKPLSHDIDMAVWCASAYVAVAGILDQSGKPDDAQMLRKASDTLYAVAGPLMTRAGLSEDDASAVSLAYATVAYAQAIERLEPAAYTKDECAEAAGAAAGAAPQ